MLFRKECGFNSRLAHQASLAASAVSEACPGVAAWGEAGRSVSAASYARASQFVWLSTKYRGSGFRVRRIALSHAAGSFGSFESRRPSG